MTKIVLNGDVVTKLPSLTTDTLIVDESGKWVGLFVPADKMYPPISDEELRRLASSKEKRITTAELLAKLEAR
jgi:hypothetical protein